MNVRRENNRTHLDGVNGALLVRRGHLEDGGDLGEVARERLDPSVDLPESVFVETCMNAYIVELVVLSEINSHLRGGGIGLLVLGRHQGLQIGNHHVRHNTCVGQILLHKSLP